MLYRTLSIFLLLSLPLFSSDPKENPNIEYVTTTYEGGLGVLPKSPDIEPKFIGTNERPIPSTVGSSTGGSIFNLIRAFVGPSEKELKRDREIEELNQQLSSSMTKRGKQQLGGIPRPNNDYSVESLTKSLQNSATQPPDPFTCYPGMPQPTPRVDIPEVPKFVATKSLTFTMANAKKASDFLDLDNAQKMGQVAEKFTTSMATPFPFSGSSGESNGGNGLAGLAGGGALLAQGATLSAPTAPAAAGAGGTVATTSWGATLGSYAAAAAPWVAVGSGAFAIGVGIGMLHDRIFYPELEDWFPSPEQRAAVLANRAVEKSKQVQKMSNNTPQSSGSPNPKKPEEPKERKFNQVQRTEAMSRIKENYRYDNQTKTYILKDNGKAIVNTRTGKPVKIVYWDKQHGDIEAWRGLYQGDHLGSIDPQTFEMYKGPDLKRTIL